MKVSNRRMAALAVLVIVLLAGVVSYYASAQPDGLTHVAANTGMDTKERDSATAGSPMADYSTAGVGNDRLSGGLAGVTGAAVVLVLVGGLTLVLRRRSPRRDGI